MSKFVSSDKMSLFVYTLLLPIGFFSITIPLPLKTFETYGIGLMGIVDDNLYDSDDTDTDSECLLKHKSNIVKTK